MTVPAFASRSEADLYVVGRLAVREGKPPEAFADLPQADIDRQIPAARSTFEHRQQIAERLRRKMGLDPQSPAAAEARDLLARIPQIGSDPTT